MDADYQLDVDIHRMCRLCLTVDENQLKNFFCNVILDDAIVAFPETYKNVTQIETKKDDKLPQGVCVTCKAKVSEFHSFKQRCIKTNALLCKILDVPIPEKVKEKQEKVDKATQSINSNTTTSQGTQTIEKNEPKRLHPKIVDYVDRKPIEKSVAKVVGEQVFKHEIEQDVEEFIEPEAEETENYVLDYECPEYLSSDTTYVIGNVCSTAECVEDPFGNKIEYKMETEADERMEDMEILDVSDTYSIVEPSSESITPKRSRKTVETCNICKAKVKFSIVNAHRNMHQQTLPMILDSIPYFRCGRCKTVFPEIYDMESHFTNGNCSLYVDEPACTDYQYLEDFPECETEEGGPFSGCRTLRLSSVMQTSDDAFSCELCYDFSSPNVHDILLHCMKHFRNEKENNVVYYDEMMPGPHRCGVCQLNQPSLSAALRHVFFHLTTFVCPVKDCDEKFTEFKFLSQHIEQRHMTRVTVKHQQCMHCGETCESYQAFRQHQLKECEKKIYRCDVCERKFFHKTSLAMHMKYHLAAKFVCEVCNKSFSQLCDYKVHYRIHSGEKPYKCDHCDKSFRSISNRKDHMSTHRTEKMFVCEICEQTFKSERTLRGHYPIHNPNKKFQCDQCDKSFHRRFHLTLHLKSHDKKDFRHINSRASVKT